MHASNAFLNGASTTRPNDLSLLRALMAGADSASPDPAKRRRDERQAEEERKAPTANEKGSEFRNDPDDASNPNEVRERHNRNVKPS